MTPTIRDRHVAFSTPWFDVVAKQVDDEAAPHYSVMPPDYVTVLASDADGRILLVKQFRPVIEAVTLELPSGLVDPGETPEASARRELVEETGHAIDAIELLGALTPDVGRLGNRMWCYAASNVQPVASPAIEEGLELVKLTPQEWMAALGELRCVHALNFAVMMLAVLRGRFAL